MTLEGCDHVVVMIRHGHTDWNLTHRLTGWTDIPLSRVGLDEAAAAGRRLATAGFGIDEVHVSLLRRTRQTANAMLAAVRAPGGPWGGHRPPPCTPPGASTSATMGPCRG